MEIFEYFNWVYYLNRILLFLILRENKDNLRVLSNWELRVDQLS